MDREYRFLKSGDDNKLYAASLVEICGSKRVLIENHRGIVSYGCNEIQVKGRCGHICIAGENLMISKMSREKLVIMGKIHGVTLRGRE